MYPSLHDLLDQVSFHENLVTQQGVICADVEYGAEAYALKALRPARLILGEPKDFGERENRITAALSAIERSTAGIQIRREDAQDLLDNVIGSGQQNFGLITWLNIFPDIRTDQEDFEDFLRKSEKLLCRGGAVILSAVEDSSDRFDLMERVVKKGVSGLTLKIIQPKSLYSSAGAIALIGKK